VKFKIELHALARTLEAEPPLQTEFVPGQKWLSDADPDLGVGTVVEVAPRRLKLAFPAVGESRIYALPDAPLTRLRLEPGDHFRDLEGNEYQVTGLEERGGLFRYRCEDPHGEPKLVEESPSVAVDDELRERMGAVAVAAARAVNYVSAGTVEFLLDKDKNFYFLEMNTRLQVEHPVTEMVTGVDIVKEMIAIADGRRLRFRQEDIEMKGWAIEARITAEDPANNFMPATGKVVALREPTGPGIRVESGIYVGMEVGLYYDPMIAKLIAYGENRAEAILRLRRALAEYRIAGVKTSIPFHLGLVDTPRFQWGQFDTRFLDGYAPPKVDDIDEKREIAALVAAMLLHQRGQQAITIGHDGRKEEGVSVWRKAALLEGLRRFV
jgi:acetyl/propionyl-CoA carboxylase alpha subunit